MLEGEELQKARHGAGLKNYLKLLDMILVVYCISMSKLMVKIVNNENYEQTMFCG